MCYILSSNTYIFFFIFERTELLELELNSFVFVMANVIYKRFISGSANHQKRRVGFRSHSLGNPDALHPATLRGIDKRTSRRKQQSLVPE